MFLTDEELITISGYKNKKFQRKWLLANGIKHIVSSQGKVLVHQMHLENILGASRPSTKSASFCTPDFEALKAHLGAR